MKQHLVQSQNNYLFRYTHHLQRKEYSQVIETSITTTKVKEAEQVCGLVNYVTTKKRPITELQKTDTTFGWTTKCQNAFILLKKELASKLWPILIA